jgi:hypothetical protein
MVVSSDKTCRMVVLVATRNRVESLRRLVRSVESTAAEPGGVGMVLGIDRDDQESMRTAQDLARSATSRIRIVPLEPSGEFNLARMSNTLYAASEEPIVGCFGDDVVFRTQGWDLAVRQEFQEDQSVLLFGDDLLQKGRLATHFFTHRRVHDAFGYYMNEKFRRIYIDTWWDQIYRSQKKIRYRPDLVFEHLHPSLNPEREDELFRKNARWEAADQQTWESEENQRDLRRASGCFRWLVWKTKWRKIIRAAGSPAKKDH